MKNAFRALDRILRGDATRLPLLRQGTFDIPTGGLSGLVVLLAMIYGGCMGLSAVITRWGTPTRYMGFQQLGASMVKVPMLFVLTLVITFPSLYVFNALVGSRLTVGAMLRLLIAAMSVMLALLASFGPIVAFFAASTTSYPFMKLLNVIVYAIAGSMGLKFLLQTLHRLTIAQEPLPPAYVPPAEGEAPAAAPEYLPPRAGALDPLQDRPPAANVTMIFRIWIIVFGLVGAQMSWVLRPFIGNPDQPFTFFRGRESNFFEGVANTVSHPLGWTGR
jgi:hypothetical protein